MKLRHASVCTGLGAAELAAGNLGWENVFMSEIDDFCCKILNYYFPNTKLYGDFTKEDFREYAGTIDVFTAGFPCQPFSVSGYRKGSEDHRYLWPQVYRLVDEFRPSWFIGENVAGIASMVFPCNEVDVESQAGLFETDYKEIQLEERYILESICRDLESIGYSVRPFIIPACAVGAPHRRNRIWIVAHYSDTGNESVREWENGVYKSKIASNSESTREQRECEQGQGEIQSYRRDSKDIQANFGNFPTQSPICSRNDGISGRLDGITFPKWRSESVKAYGNAIVPQVILSFFKVIDNIVEFNKSN